MNEIDERIRKAAAELGEALTAGGKDYWVRANAMDITSIESDGRQFSWVIEVEETATRKIAP